MFFLLALRLGNSLTFSGWVYLSYTTFGDQDSAVQQIEGFTWATDRRQTLRMQGPRTARRDRAGVLVC